MENSIESAFGTTRYFADVIYYMKINDYINASAFLNRAGHTFSEWHEQEIVRKYITYLTKTNYVDEDSLIVKPNLPEDNMYQGIYVCKSMFDMITVWLFRRDHFDEIINSLPGFKEISSLQDVTQHTTIVDVQNPPRDRTDEILRKIDSIKLDNLSNVVTKLAEEVKTVRGLVADTNLRVGGYLDANGRPYMNYCSC